MSNSDEKDKIDLEDLEKSFDELHLLGKFCTMQMLDVYLLLKYQIFPDLHVDEVFWTTLIRFLMRVKSARNMN